MCCQLRVFLQCSDGLEFQEVCRKLVLDCPHEILRNIFEAKVGHVRLVCLRNLSGKRTESVENNGMSFPKTIGILFSFSTQYPQAAEFRLTLNTDRDVSYSLISNSKNSILCTLSLRLQQKPAGPLHCINQPTQPSLRQSQGILEANGWMVARVSYLPWACPAPEPPQACTCRTAEQKSPDT